VRAQRFPLRIGLRFRRVGDPAWHRGEIKNISHSGILIRAEDFLPVQLEIEFRLALAVEKFDGEPPAVSCRGRVVRTVSPSDDEPWPGAAVAIEEYDFLREGVEQNQDQMPAASND
jgi:PilZ domain